MKTVPGVTCRVDRPRLFFLALGSPVPSAGAAGMRPARLLAVVPKLQHLQDLWLAGCTGLTDASAATVSAQLRQLRALSLARCKITDAAMSHVGRIAGLVALDVSGTGVTAAGLRHVAQLQNLRRLTLDNCKKLSDGALAFVGQVATLETLSLAGCKSITDAGLTSLAQPLLSLSVRGCRVSDAGLAKLMAGIGATCTSLDLASTQAAALALGAVASHGCAETLDLSGCANVDDTALSRLSGLAKLQTLKLGGCACVSTTSRAPADTPALTCLEIANCPDMTNASVEGIGAFTLLHPCPAVCDIALCRVCRPASS